MNGIASGARRVILTQELKVFGWMAGVCLLACFLPLSNPKVTCAAVR
jgi:hypothetical protein